MWNRISSGHDADVYIPYLYYLHDAVKISCGIWSRDSGTTHQTFLTYPHPRQYSPRSPSTVRVLPCVIAKSRTPTGVNYYKSRNYDQPHRNDPPHLRTLIFYKKKTFTLQQLHVSYIQIPSLHKWVIYGWLIFDNSIIFPNTSPLSNNHRPFLYR